ncbi:MAG: hypothetical protein IIC83_06365 [Chloroflexi bacterium]|nr:hypothetical protein [Chloroflexota bacterium]
MKWKLSGVLPVLTLLLALMFLSITSSTTALAAKPSGPDNNVIERSNGYPSGPHFNLNIHGKKDNYQCDPSPGGNSVFIREYGESTLRIASNKKSKLTELVAQDRCAEYFDGDPALVQIPSESEGYYVFARVRAKPQNGKNDGDPSSIIMTPSPILEACNDNGETDEFGDLITCSDDVEGLISLGLVTSNGVYKTTEQGFERWDSDTTTKGKGKTKATDITGLFTWTGYACDASLDLNGDGVIDENDVPNDLDGDGDIDADDLSIFLALNCTYFNEEWVFNVADLVVQDQEIVNDGVKLLKIRFYPVRTTEFTPDTPSVDAEIHDSADVNHVNVGGTTVPTGTTVHGAATLSAGTGPIPTGSVEFQRFATADCSGASVSETLPLVNGVAESGDFMTAAGVLSYLVGYTPDAASDHYTAATSPCVPLAIGTTPGVTAQIHDGLHNDITGGSVLEGTSVHARATVNGSPAGTVTFHGYGTGDCSGALVLADETVALSGGVAESSALAAVVGMLSYIVDYNGEDADFFPSVSSCVALTVTAP